MPFANAAGRKLEYEWFGEATAAAPVLVFLHEGLGSIRQWRDFPAQVAVATGWRALAYNRYGYGDSDVLEAPRKPDFMHDEARIALPELLRALKVHEPILVGHSDGASISLIHAGSAFPVRAVAVAAPHVFMEAFNLVSIADLTRTFETTDLPEKLGKYHRDPRKTFHGWSDVWQSPGFRDWDIQEFLPGISCPVLAIQGSDDQYGSMAQLHAIARQVKGSCELLEIPGCGHSPHREQPKVLLDALVRFVASVRSGQAR